MKIPKKFKKSFFLIVILAGPIIFYFVLKSGTNHYSHLPILGEKFVDSTLVNNKWVVDTQYHHIAPFQMLNSYGELVTDKTFDSSVYVANFFFATCKTICPTMSSNIEKLQKEFENNPSVKFISYTVDPEHDSPEVLNDYGKEHNAIRNKWYLVTGKKEEIYQLARESYLLNVEKGNGGPDDFIHSELFVLVDKNKRIRGIYDGTKDYEIDTCKDEIKVLLNEYKSKK